MNHTAEPNERFHTYDVAMEIIGDLAPLVGSVARGDADLGRQLRRAAASVPLNVAEGWRRQGKDRTYHYTVAAGSANEVVAALHVAVAWGHIEKEDSKDALGLLDRELAMLYKLTH